MNVFRMTSSHLATIFLIALACTSCAPPAPEQANGPMLEALTDSLEQLARSADFNGFGVALVDTNGVLYANGFGMADVQHAVPYTASTVQPIASISKTMIGLAVMKAVDLGKLRLDDPIAPYLPFPVVHPLYPDVPITVRHLATHTSSIIDTDEYLFRAWILRDTTDLTRNLALDISPCRFSPPSANMPMGTFLHNYLARDGAWYSDSVFSTLRPGTRFEYSNIGATLAALVVEKAVGMPFDAFTQQHIIGPLGMSSSTWHVENVRDSTLTQLYRTRTEAYPRYFGVTYPDGGLTASSSDMAKYMAELVKGYHGKGTVLSKGSYAEYFREQLADSNFVDRSMGAFADEHNTGIFMGSDAAGHFGHIGGDPGVFSMLFVDRSTGLGRYMIVNTDLESYAHHIQVWELLGRYAERLGRANAAK